MGNSRSFTRNKQGSPGKSKRRAAQKQRAAWDLQTAVDRASRSAIDAASGAIEAAMKSLAPALASVTNLREPEAEPEPEQDADEQSSS